MPKFKTERITLDGSERNELDFKIDVNITEGGMFTTTLPEKIMLLFKDAGISLHTNGRRNGKQGYYQEATYKDLIEAVKHDCKDYVSREMISQKMVIQYVIETSCAYLINKKGEIVPNGNWIEDGDYGKTEELSWREGTLSQNASSPHPYGVRIYCEPVWKRTYRYRSLKERIEYDRIRDTDFDRKKCPNLFWLIGLCSMRPPHGKMQEIEYTEQAAFFFVNFVKTICKLNEMLKQFVEPEMLQELIDRKFVLLPGIK